MKDSANRMPDPQAIPQFGLYGEAAVEDPSFVHIENITSRSSLNGWVIKPHRHGRMFQLICMLDGEVEVVLDDEVYSRAEPCVISIPPGAVHGFRFAPGTEGSVLTLAEPLLTDESYSRCQPYFEPLFVSPLITLFEPDSPLLAQLQQFLQQIGQELNRPDTGRALMCEWLARAVLMTLRRQLEIQGQSDARGPMSSSPLAAFRRLIENRFRDHWTVEQYADELGMSPARLNRLCKQLLGKTAKTLPQERLLLEAKRRLIYTRSNLDEIAWELGFRDPAYFSRFFKRATGSTPGSFRSENNFDTTEA
ncbi:MAG: helix-turn-helix domain-containing protein [Oceanospirillaceae bacterium]|nr:helix-turn-helix domain-containing protein [Oceanospirillaceae bacterium]